MMERGGFFALWVLKWVFGKKKKPKTSVFIGFFMVGMEGLEPTKVLHQRLFVENIFSECRLYAGFLVLVKILFLRGWCFFRASGFLGGFLVGL